MKILYFTLGYTPHDYRFLSKLSQTEHKIFYLKLHPKNISDSRPLPSNIHTLSWPGIPQTTFPPERLINLLPDFENILSEVHPDIIQAGPLQTCGFITALSGFHPFLASSWGYDLLIDAHKSAKWNWITRFTLTNSDMLLCDCQALKSEVQKLLHYPAEKFVIFPWGIEHENFTRNSKLQTWRQDLSWQHNQVIVSNRAWSSLHGIKTVLPAFYNAYKKNSNLRLLLIGNGPQANYVKNYITRHHLEERVYCPGGVTNVDMPSYLEQSDIYLSCARSDGTSISLLEAMASGLPAVVTDIASNHEWIKEKHNGWLAQTDNADEFAKCLLQASEIDKSKQIQIAHDNRQIITQKANWHHNFTKLLKAYQRLSIT